MGCSISVDYYGDNYTGDATKQGDRNHLPKMAERKVDGYE